MIKFCQYTDEDKQDFCNKPIYDEDDLCIEHRHEVYRDGMEQCGVCGKLFAGEICPECFRLSPMATDYSTEQLEFAVMRQFRVTPESS